MYSSELRRHRVHWQTTAHTHPRMQDKALNPFKLPIVETEYSHGGLIRGLSLEVPLWKVIKTQRANSTIIAPWLYFVDLLFSPHDTVDVNKLSEKMGVIDQNSFKKECNGSIHYLVRCGNFNEKQTDGIGHFLRASEMTVKHQLNFSSIDKVVLPEEKCVGFSFGKDWAGVQ